MMRPITKNELKRLRMLKQKKQRDEQQLFIAEGPKCVSDLCQHFACKLIVCTQEAATLLSETNCDVLIATPEQLLQLSLLQHPQGVIAYLAMPHYVVPSADPHSLLLALDEVQDPGNLGTIIRTADWFGIKHIVCSTDTADCFNPKVVQATMGALARVQLHYVNLPQYLLQAKQNGVQVYGTLLDGNNMYHEQPAQNGIIVMGNEGNGLSEPVRQLLTHKLFIPPFPINAATSESLNVAVSTAIVLSWCRYGK